MENYADLERIIYDKGGELNDVIIINNDDDHNNDNDSSNSNSSNR